MVDRIYKFVQTVANNELNGNVSPQEFKLELHNSVNELFEETMVELGKVLGRERRYGASFSIENLSGALRERLMHYHQNATIENTGGRYALPEDLRYLDTVEMDGIEVEPTQNRRQFKAISNYADTRPSFANPIYLRIADEIEIAPISAIAPLDIYYLRNPKMANWTYQLINNVEIFNPDAPDFQDVDIHPGEEYNLTIKLLQKIGINLKEPQITQYGLAKERSDFQEENVR